MDWPDNHHLNAAAGWLALGDVSEARAELERLAPRNRLLPEALALEWHLLAAEHRWQEASAIGVQWVDAAPGEPEAWIQRSYALHECGDTVRAWDLLLPAATLFPSLHIISYNLACYACCLDRKDVSRRWLRRALLTIKDPRERRRWRVAAQADPDLNPLWQELRDGGLC